MVTLKSPKPRYLWLSGVPLLSLRDLGPLLGAEEPKSEARRAEMLAFGRGFFVRCAAQGGCAPLEPPGGAPCTARLTSAFRRPCRGLRRGAGVPGEERPRHPAGRLGSLRSRQGAVSSPLRGCGPHQPLDPPFTEKRARGPRRGLEGHCRSGWGSRLAQRPRSGLALTPRNDPHAPGWWLGVLFPQPPATWRTPPEGRRRRS